MARLCDDTWAGEGAGLGLLDVAGPSTVEEKAQASRGSHFSGFDSGKIRKSPSNGFNFLPKVATKFIS